MFPLFTYGSLKFPEVMHALLGRQLRYECAVLHNFARYCLTAKIYPGLVFEPDAFVEGTLYFDLAEAELALLDQFEGERYQRTICRCAATSREQECFVYVTAAAARPEVLSAPWDEGAFRTHKLRGYCEMCAAFRRDHSAAKRSA